MKPLANSLSKSPEPEPSRQEQRQRPRHEPDLPRGRVIMKDGSVHDCDVMDVSMGGAALRTNAPGKLGEEATLGKMRGPIIRLLDDGFVIQFSNCA